MKYLVTGGAGFIGSHVVELLLEKASEVRVLDNFSTGKHENLSPWSKRIEVHTGDIQSPAACEAAMKGVNAVIHLAAQASVTRSVEQPLETTSINIAGTHLLLEAARKAKVKAFVFASTCAVYGNTTTLPIQEDCVPDPLSPYAASKLSGEFLVRLYRQLFEIPTVVFRLFNVYGPRQDPSSPYSGVISAFSNAVVKGKTGVIYGDGKQTRDFVFVKDVARLFCLAAEAPGGFVAPAYNIANEVGVSIQKLYELIAEMNGKPATPRFEAARAGEVKHSRGSSALLYSVLGKDESSRRIALQEGLSKTFPGYK